MLFLQFMLCVSYMLEDKKWQQEHDTYSSDPGIGSCESRGSHSQKPLRTVYTLARCGQKVIKALSHFALGDWRVCI